MGTMNQDQFREAIEAVYNGRNSVTWDENGAKVYRNSLQMILDIASEVHDGKWVRKEELERKMEGLEEIILSKHIYTNGGTDSDDFVTVPINELASAIREYLGVK
jgi:hypothetical protein